MCMSATPRTMSIADYLVLDEESDEKFELLSGVVVAMSGAAPRDNAICVNTSALLRAALADSPCVVLDQGQRVHIESTGSYLYPDVTVACEPRFTDERPPSLRNPRLVVEVLSPSTRDHDMGAKLGHYRSLPGLQEVLMVEPDRRFASHYQRLESGQWLITDVTEGAVELPSLSVSLPMDELYAKVDALPASAASE